MKRFLSTLLTLAMLVGGTALAEDAPWSIRAYLAHEGQDGNRALLSLVQPINRAFESDALRVDVIDATYDGYMVAMAMAITNKTSAPLLLISDQSFGDAGVGMIGTYHIDEHVLLPNATIDAGLDAQVSDGDLYIYGEAGAPLDACDVVLDFTSYALTGELVSASMTDDFSYETMLAQGNAEAESGNLVVDEYGQIYGQDILWKPGMSRTESIEVSGLFENPVPLSVSLRVENNAETVSLLPGGKPAERDNGAYTLRVSRADLTPNALVLDIEKVFATEDAATAHTRDLPGAMSRLGFAVLDETGGEQWAHSFGGGEDSDVAKENDQGEWILAYRYVVTSLTRLPQTLTVLPTHVSTDYISSPEGPRAQSAGVGVELTIPEH